jgi:diacylglycerol O-acyltransferase / wax synthase
VGQEHVEYLNNPVGRATRALSGAVEIVDGLLRSTPTSLVGSVTTMRRYAAAEVSLKDVALVCHAFDVTLNDVALAAITDAFRAMLIRRGEKPQRNSLRTLVPVSVRSNDAMDKVDNRVSPDASVPSGRSVRPRGPTTNRA